MQRSYLSVVKFTLVKSCSTVVKVTRKSNVHRLHDAIHHRIQTDLKGVDACTPASTPCTSVSTKSCVDCRAFCAGGCRLQQAACKRLQFACRLHAGFMQPAYDRTCRRLQVAASCMQDVAGCMQAACSLQAACMHL